MDFPVPSEQSKFLQAPMLRIIGIVIGVLLTVIILVGYCAGDRGKKEKVQIPTTTTTLPDKDAQACEFLTESALLAGGIISDVKPQTSDDRKRCTYEDIGGEINYITLYVDVASQCDTLFQNTTDQVPLPDVSPNAIYSQETDPTIIVLLGERCFFVQGAKTIITKETLTKIAQAITESFIAVDSTTTTTMPQETLVPVSSANTLPGQNTTIITTTSSP